VSHPDAADAAERAVVGAMLLSADVIDPAVDALGQVEPLHPANAAVYRAIRALHSANQPADAVTVLARLIEVGAVPRTVTANYVHELIRDVPTAASATHYARLVVEQATRRRIAEAGARLTDVSNIADPDRRADRLAVVRAELETLADPPAAGVPRATPLDWSAFLTREQGPVDFLAGRLMVRGQQIALVGAGKAGKSLFAVEWAWRIAAGLEFLGDHARPPLRVLYIDQENPDDDIQERLLSLGATPETLQNLTYLSFPAFRPLNTEAGASDLLAVVDEYRPAVLIFDTISRMVKGKENEADPWLDLYRLALMPLKARKVSSIRLDHFGKDATRGGRGNSAKTQDVDAVWELVPVEDDATLLQLTRTHTRNGKGLDDALIRRHGEQVGDRWKAGGTWHGIADASERPEVTPDVEKQFPPAARRVLGVLGTSQLPLTVTEIGDILAGQNDGPLKRRTVQDALKKLAEANRADEVDAHPGKAPLWQVIR
jgi:AAA domain/DnaB-like helicase N terminal domain